MFSSILAINHGVYSLVRNISVALKVARLFMLAINFYPQVPTTSRSVNVQG